MHPGPGFRDGQAVDGATVAQTMDGDQPAWQQQPPTVRAEQEAAQQRQQAALRDEPASA